MKTKYFYTENEAVEYGRSLDLNYYSATYEEAQAYMSQYKDIDGCEIVYAITSNGWRDETLRMCILWKGVLMYADIPGSWYGRKFPSTFEMKMAEPTDWQGIGSDSREAEGKPQNIGKPTAKKLDQWREWLLTNRKYQEDIRDRKFAEMTAKVAQVCELFPEAKAVKWTGNENHKEWRFEKSCNGIMYYCYIWSSGKIEEKFDFAYDNYRLLADTAEIAARMMKNDLAGVRHADHDKEKPAYIQNAEKWQERVSKYMGGRPF